MSKVTSVNVHTVRLAITQVLHLLVGQSPAGTALRKVSTAIDEAVLDNSQIREMCDHLLQTHTWGSEKDLASTMFRDGACLGVLVGLSLSQEGREAFAAAKRETREDVPQEQQEVNDLFKKLAARILWWGSREAYDYTAEGLHFQLVELIRRHGHRFNPDVAVVDPDGKYAVRWTFTRGREQAVTCRWPIDPHLHQAFGLKGVVRLTDDELHDLGGDRTVAEDDLLILSDDVI